MTPGQLTYRNFRPKSLLRRGGRKLLIPVRMTGVVMKASRGFLAFLLLLSVTQTLAARERSDGNGLYFLRPLEYSLSLEPLDSKSPDDLTRTERLGLLGARIDFL